MKAALIVILILAAIMCAGTGLLFAADPEGRGTKTAMKWWGGAAIVCAFIGVVWTAL